MGGTGQVWLIFNSACIVGVDCLDLMGFGQSRCRSC